MAFEPETGVFADVALTGGSGADNHEAAVARDLLADDAPVTALGDAAYGTGDLRQHLQAQGHAPVLKPPPLKPAVPGGFTADEFTVDTDKGEVTCPAGHTVKNDTWLHNRAAALNLRRLINLGLTRTPTTPGRSPPHPHRRPPSPTAQQPLHKIFSDLLVSRVSKSP